MQAFLNEQFAAPISTFPAPATDDDMSFVQKRFFTNALTGQDQLRQRVAWGLSQIMVASAVKINNPSAFVLWQNMFQNDAFGNFSTLLTDVTLSPVMGNYLDMVNNDKPGNGVDPNENFAREILQLFSIGLEQLNPDGTLQLDGSGNPIPTYGQDRSRLRSTFHGMDLPDQTGRDRQIPQSRVLRRAHDSLRQPSRYRLETAAEWSDTAGGRNHAGGPDGSAAKHFQSSQRGSVHLQAAHSASGNEQSQLPSTWAAWRPYSPTTAAACGAT